MHYHGPVIRPHTDTDRLILEITSGCSHNACTFCNFYKGTKFWVAPLSQVEEDLKEAKAKWPSCKKIWASGGNPFVLSTEKQIERWDLIRRYFPDAHLSTYANVADFRQKTKEEVKLIHEHGLDDIMIGIESGDDEVLEHVNKGYSSQDIIDACQKMDDAGITYRLIYLGGLAGRGKLEASARRSAAVINQLHSPHMNFTNVSVLPGTKLYEEMISGEWEEASELERIKEIRALIGNLNVPMTINATTSANNLTFEVDLATQKEDFMLWIDQVIDSFTEADECQLSNRRHSMRSV